MRITIGQKLTFGFVGIALLIAAIGSVSIDTSQKALEKSIGQNAVFLAGETLDDIDRGIYHRIERWQAYCATNPRLKEAILSSNHEFEKLGNIQEYIYNQDQQWLSAPREEITPFMAGLIGHELSEELRTKVEFHEEEYGYTVFGEVFVTNKYGANVAQTRKTTDFYQADEQWWQVGKRDGLYVGDVEYDKSARVYSTDVAIRIDDRAGNFIGVMKVVLNIEDAIEIIRKAGEGSTYDSAKLRLFNKQGRVIFDESGELEPSENIPDKRLLEGATRGAGYLIRTGQRGAGETVFAYAHSKGYRDYEGLGWILAVEQATSEVFAGVRRLRKTIFIISFGVTIFAVLAGFFISRSVSAPIAKLKDATVEIGKGNLDARIEINSNDEVGQLATFFRKMTDNLKKTTASIDKLNREITARKKAEEGLVALNSALESTVQELSRSNKELQDFAYIISHDLKAPVRGISTLADWVSKDYADKLGQDGREQMAMLEGRAHRINNLIDGILDYSRVGRAKEKQVGIDLNELVADLIDIVAPPENIEITVQSELPVIICEKTPLMQILENLLSNAVKFMDKPNGQIKVGCVEQDGFWKFSVADNGPGIEQKYFEKIFQVFQTLRPRDEFESTGVGLSMAKKAVEVSGGEIWLESEVGKGSTFFFTLPKQDWGAKDAKHETDNVG